MIEPPSNADAESVDDMTVRNARLALLWTRIDATIEPYRREAIKRTAAGRASTDETLACLDAIRWLRRVCYHAWRIAYHLDPTVCSIAFEEETEPAMENGHGS